MPKLYLANTTKQRRDFYYFQPNKDGTPPKPGTPHTRVTLVPGGPLLLPGDYSLAWIKALVEREQRYGWISATEFSRNRGFIGIIYSIDKPVSESLISATIEKNDDVMDEAAMQEQRRVALAASQMGNGIDTMPTTTAPVAFDMELNEKPLVGDRSDKDVTNTTIEVRRGQQGPTRRIGRQRKAA